MKRRLFLVSGLFLLMVSAAAQAADDQVIFVVRHAERADGGGARGRGMSDDPPLSTDGVGRALRLASMLRAANVKHIFVTTFQRTRQTAEPLAKQQHLEIDTSASATVDTLVDKLRKTEGRSLVVGHSNTVPEILSKLGVAETVDVEEEFDNLFIVVLKPAGAPTFIRLKY
jgi:phosphohistidine phosphatase SixA